jgi:hypothetical protein
MTKMNQLINYDCLHCNAYFTNRTDIQKKQKKKYYSTINENCTNPYCNTIIKIGKMIEKNEIKETEDTREIMDSDDAVFTNKYDEYTNWDNWDLETNVKSLKRKRENSINDLQDLFKNIYITENKSTAGKKEKKLKQQKITSYDINYLLNKLDLKV